MWILKLPWRCFWVAYQAFQLLGVEYSGRAHQPYVQTRLFVLAPERRLFRKLRLRVKIKPNVSRHICASLI